MNKHPEFLIVLVVVFLALVIFSIIHREETKRIRKAAHALQIPERYIPFVKHLLLSLYKHHEYLFRLENHDFYYAVRQHQSDTLNKINKKINCEIINDQLVSLENHYFDELDTRHKRILYT